MGGIGRGMDGSGCVGACCCIVQAFPSSDCVVLYVIPSSYPHNSSPVYSGEARDSGDITIAGGRPRAEDDVTSDELSSSIRSVWNPPLFDQRRLMSASASHAPISTTADGHPP